MPDEFYYSPRYPRSFLLEFFLEIFRDPKQRRILFLVCLFLVGSYLVLTQGGDIETETVVFVGWGIEGNGIFTTGHYDVCTDPMNREETEFKMYHHSLGGWSPLDKVDEYGDMDIRGWYIITYQKTFLGNKLIKVEKK